MNLAPARDPFTHWHRVNARNTALVAAFNGGARPLADWWSWQSAKIRKVEVHQ